MSKHNRCCPKCGASCIGVIFDDVKEGYEETHEFYWQNLGVACSECKWELQLRSANS